MKNLILNISILILSFTSFAQLETKDVTDDFTTIYKQLSSSISVDVHNETGIVFLNYRNASYKYIVDIQSIGFNDLNELVDFLDICKKVATDERDKTYEIVGLNESVTVKHFIGKSVTVYVSSNDFVYLGRKTLDKIITSIKQ